MSLSDLRIGQIVEVGDGALGTVRYIGQPLFAPGDWIGVELEDGGGKNDGSVKGERYFECEMGRGMFVRLAAITIIDQPAPPPPKPAPTRRQPGRQSSVSGPSDTRRTSSVTDPNAAKRRSQNAASPTPVNRRPSSLLRVSMFCACKISSLIILFSPLRSRLRNNYTLQILPLPLHHGLVPPPMLEHHLLVSQKHDLHRLQVAHLWDPHPRQPAEGSR